jgi:hypothetical protein
MEAMPTILVHIEPGEPWQDCYGQAFNARLGYDCLGM